MADEARTCERDSGERRHCCCHYTDGERTGPALTFAATRGPRIIASEREEPVMKTAPSAALLDSIHHIAVSVTDVKAAVEWYTRTFQCKVTYQDDTWAFLEFANLKL